MKRRTAKSKVKLRASVFREAAELLGLPRYKIIGACSAIRHVIETHTGVWDLTSPEHAFFQQILRPPSRTLAWWYNEEPYTRDIVTARMLGLLLCVELVRDGWTLDS